MSKTTKKSVAKKVTKKVAAPVQLTPAQELRKALEDAYPNVMLRMAKVLDVEVRPSRKHPILVYIHPTSKQSFVINDATLLTAEKMLTPATLPIHNRHIMGTVCTDFLVAIAHDIAGRKGSKK